MTKTAIYKTLHRKLKTEQREPHKTLWMNSGSPEGYAVPAPYVAPAVLLLLLVDDFGV